MSKKNLLNEGTIRRFMKLAEIEPLTDQFVDKINEADMKKDDKEKKHGKPSPFDPTPDMGDDEKVEEGMYGKKDDMKEGMGMSYTDDEEADGMRPDMMEEELDDTIDEDLDALLAEMELDEGGMDYQDDGDDMPDDMPDDMAVMDDMPEDGMDAEGPAEPAMGGMDPQAIADMVKDAVMDALQDLVDDGKISVEDEESEEVQVSGAEDEDEKDEDEDEMVNEVARRVMRRIINSRR